jgi:hypothetical protein
LTVLLIETKMMRLLGASRTLTAAFFWSAGTSEMGGRMIASTWAARSRLSRVAASGTMRMVTVS